MHEMRKRMYFSKDKNYLIQLEKYVKSKIPNDVYVYDVSKIIIPPMMDEDDIAIFIEFYDRSEENIALVEKFRKLYNGKIRMLRMYIPRNYSEWKYKKFKECSEDENTSLSGKEQNSCFDGQS